MIIVHHPITTMISSVVHLGLRGNTFFTTSRMRFCVEYYIMTRIIHRTICVYNIILLVNRGMIKWVGGEKNPR
jgi:hypothetical protein